MRNPVVPEQTTEEGFEIRKLVIGNYLVFYRVNDESRLVEVLAFCAWRKIERRHLRTTRMHLFGRWISMKILPIACVGCSGQATSCTGFATVRLVDKKVSVATQRARSRQSQAS